MRVGSLFTGIGGFDLGLERAGMRTVWFCEQDPYCQRVLAKHWPGVPCYPDVRALVADTGRGGVQRGGADREVHGAAAEEREHGRATSSDPSGSGGEGRNEVLVSVPPVDVLCGGFPCQDISFAGRGAGLAGERSGLWREFARLIGELRPRYVVVENVPALTSRGLDVVLSDLAACGFDAEWDHLPAAAFGAPHRRDRVWLVAYPDGQGPQGHGRLVERTRELAAAASGAATGARDVADAAIGRGQRWRTGSSAEEEWRPFGLSARPDEGNRGQWELEPDVGRVAHGVPHRVDRLRSLGNALVPQIAEWIGRRIIEAEEK